MAIIVGVDGDSKYTVNVGTRKITVSNLGFDLTQEGLLYVLNITQGINYYVAAENYTKATVVGSNIIYESLDAFPVLAQGDKIHIQLKEPESIGDEPVNDLEGNDLLNEILKEIKITNLHLSIINDGCLEQEDTACQ
jgi:hypothetical protein